MYSTNFPFIPPGSARRPSAASSTTSSTLAPPPAGRRQRSPARRGSMPAHMAGRVGGLVGDVPGGAAGGRRYSQSNLITALHGRRFSAAPDAAVKYQVSFFFRL